MIPKVIVLFFIDSSSMNSPKAFVGLFASEQAVERWIRDRYVVKSEKSIQSLLEHDYKMEMHYVLD